MPALYWEYLLQFHQFLILAIYNYFMALRVFKKVAKVIKTTYNTQNTSNPKPLMQLIAPAKPLQTHLHLLWSIVQSRTFKRFFQLLYAEGELQRASHGLEATSHSTAGGLLQQAELDC